MKSALLTVAWNSDNWTFDALESHYQTLVRYLDFQDQGMVLGRGVRDSINDQAQPVSGKWRINWETGYDYCLLKIG